jgi:uncharacterized protein with GYD domain
MATYVVLMNWTDQGIKAAKQTVDRYHDAKKLIEGAGGTVESIYWTIGSHDLVVVTTAPDDETLAAILLSIAGAGNLRTQTLRAFTESEMTSVIGKMR